VKFGHVAFEIAIVQTDKQTGSTQVLKRLNMLVTFINGRLPTLVASDDFACCVFIYRYMT